MRAGWYVWTDGFYKRYFNGEHWEGEPIAPTEVPGYEPEVETGPTPVNDAPDNGDAQAETTQVETGHNESVLDAFEHDEYEETWEESDAEPDEFEFSYGLAGVEVLGEIADVTDMFDLLKQFSDVPLRVKTTQLITIEDSQLSIAQIGMDNGNYRLGRKGYLDLSGEVKETAFAVDFEQLDLASIRRASGAIQVRLESIDGTQWNRLAIGNQNGWLHLPIINDPELYSLFSESDQNEPNARLYLSLTNADSMISVIEREKLRDKPIRLIVQRVPDATNVQSPARVYLRDESQPNDRKVLVTLDANGMVGLIGRFQGRADDLVSILKFIRGIYKEDASTLRYLCFHSWGLMAEYTEIDGGNRRQTRVSEIPGT